MSGPSLETEGVQRLSAPHELTRTSAIANARGPAAFFTGALLKVASRCNLDCSYCYVYKHADQSWRDQPRFMSDATIDRFAVRLTDYVTARNLKEFSITFHGGEPLLYGAEKLARAADIMRRTVGARCALDFSLQTNGTLLDDDAIAHLELADIGVSLSLDGPEQVNDRHRRDHGGRSSFVRVVDAIRRLQKRHSPIFRGVIAVIDPETPPQTLFEFFTHLEIPQLDLLLPDATHERRPPGRDEQATLYSDWLREALTLWISSYASLPVRWFDTLLASRLGVPSPTDAIGLGAVSLLVMDTDGSYTDHDVFKITAPGGGVLNCGVHDTSFEEVSGHPVLREHGFRLTLDGLALECQNCPVVEACGGGSVMHRWDSQRGLDAPSVYCHELFSTLETATQIVRAGISKQHSEVAWRAIPALKGEDFVAECIRWRVGTEAKANEAAARRGLTRRGESAASWLLMERDVASHLSSAATTIEPSYHRWLGEIVLQSNDQQLIAPFAESIRYLPVDSEPVREGMAALERVRELHAAFDPHLPAAFQALISDIVFVESTLDSEASIFSFSDDSAPNVLYIAPYCHGSLLAIDDLSDSLLHEFLHHVLYQMERDGPMLQDYLYPRFPAPWRGGLRTAGGFFHGTFVFASLAQYWTTLAQTKLVDAPPEKAASNARRFSEQAIFGIQSLRQFALLTERGEMLLEHLAKTLHRDAAQRMHAPGQRLVR